MGVGHVSTVKLVLEAFGVLGFYLGTSSMNSKLTGEGDEDEDVVQKKHCSFRYKRQLLSIEMKTKLVQHVESD